MNDKVCSVCHQPYEKESWRSDYAGFCPTCCSKKTERDLDIDAENERQQAMRQEMNRGHEIEHYHKYGSPPPFSLYP